MATLEEIKALQDEAVALFEKIKELDPDRFNETADELRDTLKQMKKKSDLSTNIEEDMEPVSEKDMAVGLRNY